MRRGIAKDLIILFVAVAALACAAVNMHVSLNMVVEGASGKEDDDD